MRKSLYQYFRVGSGLGWWAKSGRDRSNLAHQVPTRDWKCRASIPSSGASGCSRAVNKFSEIQCDPPPAGIRSRCRDLMNSPLIGASMAPYVIAPIQMSYSVSLDATLRYDDEDDVDVDGMTIQRATVYLALHLPSRIAQLLRYLQPLDPPLLWRTDPRDLIRTDSHNGRRRRPASLCDSMEFVHPCLCHPTAPRFSAISR